jgi:hypothetical protein
MLIFFKFLFYFSITFTEVFPCFLKIKKLTLFAEKLPETTTDATTEFKKMQYWEISNAHVEFVRNC